VSLLSSAAGIVVFDCIEFAERNDFTPFHRHPVLLQCRKNVTVVAKGWIAAGMVNVIPPD